MHSVSTSELLFESSLSIFNGRLCALSISASGQKTIRVSSPSDVSILLEATLDSANFDNLQETLRKITEIWIKDPGILGPRVELGHDARLQLIVDQNLSIPLSEPSAAEKFEHVLGSYAKQQLELKIAAEKCAQLTKQLDEQAVEFNSMKQRCEFQEKEIILLRELTGRKRTRIESRNETPVKKRRQCRCEDDGESCGSECDAEIDEDDEEEEEGIQMFRAAAAKLQMAAENVEVSSETPNKSIPEIMKQLEKISSVIVKSEQKWAEPGSSSSGRSHPKQVKAEENPATSGQAGPDPKPNLVGVVQYVICQLCPEEQQTSVDVSNQKAMEEHFLDKHVDKEKKTCEACPSDRFQPHNIGQHYRLHTNSVYACEHCGKRGRRNYLMSHIRTHTGEKPFQCDTCSKRFSDTSTLRRHRLIHTGEKKYQCPVCGRAIARKDNVKVHIRSHGIQL